MTLQQERFPFRRSGFELTETALMVSASRLLQSHRGEIPLRELRAAPSYLKQFALAPLMFAISLTLFASAFLIGGFDKEVSGDERLGLWVLSSAVGFLAACVWLRFFDRTGNYVIFHHKMTGRPAVFIHRTLPSTRHVEEFVEILREKIEQATLA